MHLALIGYRGAGKTTIGPLVAALARVASFDADQELEKAAGRSIGEIFASQGEAHFRDLETRLLRELLARPRSVLSLGGGVVLRGENRQLLKTCFTVWLTAPLEVILERLEGDAEKRAQRPSLTGLPPREEVARLLETRAPLYAECADLTVETEKMSAEEAARTIFEAWSAREVGTGGWGLGENRE